MTDRQRQLVRRFIRISGYDPSGLDDYQLRCLAGYIVVVGR